MKVIDDAELERILATANRDHESVIHQVADNAEAIFTWDYGKGARPQLSKLYEKAKGAMWNGETDLPWDTEVDQESRAATQVALMQSMLGSVDIPDSPFAGWGDAEFTRFAIEQENWMLSQFLHGEQGALVCTAKIVETVPWIDAKYYAATQVMDEARHVEVFAKYLDKLSGHYPVNTHLAALLDDIIGDSRWDMTYLGMQILVEGLALAAFGLMRTFTEEPLLEQLLRYVMADEARHVAFGVLSLKELYGELTDAEMAERQEFAFEGALRLRDRLLAQEVWDRMGVDLRKAVSFRLNNPGQIMFQQLLFSKIVPNCKKLGLLDRNGGWLRERFGEIGVLLFEDAEDTSTEYELLQIAQ